MSYKNVYLLLVIMIFTSCGVKQISTNNFAPMNDPTELNGRYINKSGNEYLSNVLLKMYDSNRDKSIDLVDIYLPTKDSLVVSYVDAAGNEKTFGFKGEFKDNYFEYYLEKKRLYVPPFLMRHWISKRRIGKDKEGIIEIHQYENYWGALFIICGGNSQADSITFKPYNKDTDSKLLRIKVDDKWGYKDKNDSIVITPQYQYAEPFEREITQVSLNQKWGYIDTLNQIVIPIVYDLIIPSKDGLFRVVKDSKWGLIDLKNDIIIPFEYNKIDDFGNNMPNDSLFNKLAKVYKGDKVGFINTKGEEIISIEYDEIGYDYLDSNDSNFYRTKQGGKYGYVTGNGVFCYPIFDEAKGFSSSNNGKNKIFDKIGLYAKVKYKGKSYILDQNGMMYTYKHLLDRISSFDYDSGIKVSK